MKKMKTTNTTTHTYIAKKIIEQHPNTVQQKGSRTPRSFPHIFSNRGLCAHSVFALLPATSYIFRGGGSFLPTIFLSFSFFICCLVFVRVKEMGRENLFGCCARNGGGRQCPEECEKHKHEDTDRLVSGFWRIS